MNKMWRGREEIDNPSSEDIQSWIQTLHHKNKDFFYWTTPIGKFGVHNVNKQRVTIAFAKQEHRFKNREIYGSLLDPAFLDSNKKIKVSADPWGSDIYLRETVTKTTAVVVLTYFHEHHSFPDCVLWSRKWKENPPIENEQEALIRELHKQFMNGEMSQGKLAEMLGISRRDLIDLLEKMGLQVTNL